MQTSTQPAGMFRDAAGNKLEFKGKLGDSGELEIYFQDAAGGIDVPAGAVFQLEAKEVDAFDDDPLVRITDFTLVTPAEGSTYLTAAPEWHSQAVLDIFAAATGADKRQLTTMAELTWVLADDSVYSSSTFTITILNDVIKAVGGSAAPLPPALVLSSQITSYNGASVVGFAGGSLNDLLEHLGDDLSAHLASIDVLEARDWVQLTRNQFTESKSTQFYPLNVLSVMTVDSWNGGGFGSAGTVYTDRRPNATIYASQTMGDFSREDSLVGWSPWKKTIQSEAGVISDDLEFSGKLKLSGLTEYADDTAAGVGGLVAGDIYTTTGALKIKL